MAKWEAVKLTGNYYEAGAPEIGNRCRHEHRSREAAERCAAKQEAPGFHEWRAAKIEE